MTRTTNLRTVARLVPLAALLLSACMSQNAYDQQAQELQQAQAQVATQQNQIASLQAQQKWVVAGDMLFPEGGYQLSPTASRR